MAERSRQLPRLVVQVARKGKLVTGEPFFTPGVPLILETKGWGALENGDLAMVQVGPGRAKVERVIGHADRIENVLEALLIERGLRVEYEPHTIPEPSLENRVDLRELTTYTIDPDTAKDFDDALSFRREPDGIRAWVHIADVSYFVPAGCPLDQGAAQRGFSTYVPGLVAPMLPHSLADDACSLRPNVERLTVTVEMPPGDGEPIFYRSVIRSDARLTYGQAQRREAPPVILEQLDMNSELATEWRRRRFARGALEVTTPEVVFSFDEGKVTNAWMEGEPHAHMLVEELMIRANEYVAAFLAGRGREALYRVHEEPDPQAIQLLLAKLADLKVPTPPVPEHLSPHSAAELSGILSHAVAAYVKSSGRGTEAFPALVLRALKQARYDPANLGHSGLASVAYCHFTSPIRRYPDLVIHRALLREIGQSDDALPGDLDGLAEHLSFVERGAGKLEHMADDICLAWLLEDRMLERGWKDPWVGQIVGVIESGLFVLFGEVFEGYLPVRRLPGDYFELNVTGTALTGKRGGRTYRLGDTIEVMIHSIKKSEGKVDLALPDSPADGTRKPKPAKSGVSRPPSGSARGGKRAGASSKRSKRGSRRS
ncbi:MAG: RNB domain-containing ribonuclease [Actinobacteria bacterium]|uniref:Unannotated protein n=1 Tax=freshwater metagenome TaxID=449393 RepID=A0A6J6PBU5_9ZZZZ|nr:RNB domain-containing ribonuclease [Actinomycetota bacterium]